MTYPLTRIDSSGGSSTIKYYFDAGVSVNAVNYALAVFVINIGGKSLVVTNNSGGSVTIAPGTFQLVALTLAGDGTAHVQLCFAALSAGDTLAFYASTPSLIRTDTGAQLIPTADQAFATGWTAYMGATVAITQTGWNLVTSMPSDIARQIDVDIYDSVGETESPFTKQAQQQEWPGADWWEWNVSLPQKNGLAAQSWEAFLMALRGKANVFQLGHPLRTLPTGFSPAFSHIVPVVDNTITGVNLPTAKVLYMRGWAGSGWGGPITAPANGTLLLAAGDYIQLGLRLHVVLAPVLYGADSQSVEIWPSLREQPPDGSHVGLYGTVGLWRLKENKRNWSVDKSKFQAFAFHLKEVR